LSSRRGRRHADLAQARLIADDDSLTAIGAGRSRRLALALEQEQLGMMSLPADLAVGADRPARDEVLDPDGNIVDRGHDDVADLADARLLLLAQVAGGEIGTVERQHLLHGIDAATK
jgi:hypothetical protein